MTGSSLWGTVDPRSAQHDHETPREVCSGLGERQVLRVPGVRMGKTRDVFKKTKDTKGTFHAKMGSIKDRNGIDLTEAEDIIPGGGSPHPRVQI